MIAPSSSTLSRVAWLSWYLGLAPLWNLHLMLSIGGLDWLRAVLTPYEVGGLARTR